jgi:hypothetical protein
VGFRTDCNNGGGDVQCSRPYKSIFVTGKFGLGWLLTGERIREAKCALDSLEKRKSNIYDRQALEVCKSDFM